MGEKAQRNDKQASARDVARKAAKTAKAVKSGKQTVKAAGKVAAGDYVGAAKDVLKDENLRAIIIGVAIFFICIPIMMFSLVPNVLFLPVESAYTDNSIISTITDIIQGIFSG